MNKNRLDMELLAPAGGWEQLECALRFGADAVYLAAERFGMRQRAANFKLAEMDRVVAYVHDRGKKVHVTCNTVMHDPDLDALPAYFETIQSAGVDALIVGDLGAMRLAKTHAPDVQLHVSTQASVSNREAALAYYELGARRIVCARELSLDAIYALKQSVPADLELEAFAHGSMCMAYSGRCLISDFVNGRSALSGHCTQPCRWKYALQEETRPGEYFPIEEDATGSFILNSKDLNMLAHLDDMAAAGVDSIKIEGRNKKAYYVATVVNAYRHVLDGESADVWGRELETVSHRPYHTGFFYGPAHQTPESDDYVRACEWVATVQSCEPVADGTFAATVVCRNRFSSRDRLEALQPGGPTVSVPVERIAHLGEDPAGTNGSTSVEVANRNMEYYVVFTRTAIAAGSMLRAWR